MMLIIINNLKQFIKVDVDYDEEYATICVMMLIMMSGGVMIHDPLLHL